MSSAVPCDLCCGTGVLKLHTDNQCNKCKGYGYLIDGQPLCPECEGDGSVMEMKCYGGKPLEVTEECVTCDGIGYIEDIRVCECGSDKLNLGYHSHWCPKGDSNE